MAGPRDRHVGETALLGQAVPPQGEPVGVEQVLHLVLVDVRRLQRAELEGRERAGIGAQGVGELVEPRHPRPVPDAEVVRRRRRVAREDALDHADDGVHLWTVTFTCTTREFGTVSEQFLAMSDTLEVAA